MTAILKPKYTAAGKPITWTVFATLASHATAGAECAIVDNTTDLYTQVSVHIQLKPFNSATANDKCVYFYAYEAILDDASAEIYPDSVNGTDRAITPSQGTLKYLGATDLLVANISYTKTFDLSNAFGGRIPRKWGLVARNYCGQTLIEGVVHYQGSNMEIV